MADLLAALCLEGFEERQAAEEKKQLEAALKEQERLKAEDILVQEEAKKIAAEMKEAKTQNLKEITIRGWIHVKNEKILRRSLIKVDKIARKKYHVGSPTRPSHTRISWSV